MNITIRIPSPGTLRRYWKWSVLPLLALVLMITWGRDGTDSAVAQGGGGFAALGHGETAGFPPGPDFSMMVASPSGDPCDNTVGVDDKKCMIHPGDKFTVVVSLDAVGFLGAYTDAVISLHFSPGLTWQDLPDECAMAGGPLVAAAEFPMIVPGDQQMWAVDCVSPPGPTGYVGPIAVVEFACPSYKSKETITMVHGTDNPGTGYIFDTFLAAFPGPVISPEHVAGALISETIVINCNNYYPWDVHGPGQSVAVDGIVDLANDILGVIQHYCPNPGTPCAKPTP